MGDAVEVVNMEVVIQDNGIIRRVDNGYIIGRLVDDVRFEDLKNKNEKDDDSMKKFRKKPVVIDAVQLREDNVQECYEFIGISNQGNFQETGHGIDPSDGKFKITTLEGVHVANIGDYIIKGVKGEFYPCKPDIFELTYEPV